MNFKSLVIFFTGAGAGGLGVWLYLKERYEKELEAELENLNAAYEKEIAGLGADGSYTEEDPKEDTGLDMKVFKHEIAKQAYDSYFNNSSDEDESDGATEEREEEEMPPVHPVETVDYPYLISANDFATDMSHDKIALTYYINADVICEDDKLLDDPAEQVIGEEWRDSLHESPEGVVYVRNEKLGADYEVILDESSKDFVKEILGFGTE